MGDPIHAGFAAYETKIPEGVRLPKTLESVWLYTVSEIPAGTFIDNTALYEISLDSAQKIGNEAFAGCSALQKVMMPERGTTPPKPVNPSQASPSGRDRGAHYGSWTQDARGWRYALGGRYRPPSGSTCRTTASGIISAQKPVPPTECFLRIRRHRTDILWMRTGRASGKKMIGPEVVIRLPALPDRPSARHTAGRRNCFSDISF